MDGIKVLETEHSNIVDFTNVLRAMGIKAMNERVVEPEDFLKAVDFVRRYSEKQHHRIEENSFQDYDGTFRSTGTAIDRERNDGGA